MWFHFNKICSEIRWASSPAGGAEVVCSLDQQTSVLRKSPPTSFNLSHEKDSSTICLKEHRPSVVSAAVSITSTRTGKRSISLQALSPRDLLKPRGVPSYAGWSPKVKSTDIANKVREIARRYPGFAYTISEDGGAVWHQDRSKANQADS